MAIEGDILPPEEALDASSRMFRQYAAEFVQLARNAIRQYAAEFVQLARNATSTETRFLYIKMASIWQETAIRWERDLLRDQEKLHRESAAKSA